MCKILRIEIINKILSLSSFRPRFENFDMPRSTYEQMDGGGSGGGGAGGMGDDGGGDSPCSLDDYERPPLRHIDKYLKAELPCVKTIRYTMALMTCLGFIISFGMRCNLGMAKLSSTPVVRHRVILTILHLIVLSSIAPSTDKGHQLWRLIKYLYQGMGINHC